MGTDITRITLYFDLSDKQEASVAHFLEKMGRKKTKVIAKILDDFICKSFSNSEDINAYQSADVSMFLRTGRFPNMVTEQLVDSTDLRREVDELKRIVSGLTDGKTEKPIEPHSNLTDVPLETSDATNINSADSSSDELLEENNQVNEDMDLSLMDGFF